MQEEPLPRDSSTHSWSPAFCLIPMLQPGWWDATRSGGGKKSNENHDGREGTVVIGSDLSFTGCQPILAQADKMNRYDEQSNHRQLFSTACTWSDTHSPSSGMSCTVLIEKVRSWSWKYSITFPIMCESMVSCSQCWQKSSLPPLLNIQMGHIYTFPLAAKSALDN